MSARVIRIPGLAGAPAASGSEHRYLVMLPACALAPRMIRPAVPVHVHAKYLSLMRLMIMVSMA